MRCMVTHGPSTLQTALGSSNMKENISNSKYDHLTDKKWPPDLYTVPSPIDMFKELLVTEAGYQSFPAPQQKD
jgi:hypothetical protein